MRRIALFLLTLTLVAGAQTKYFLPFSVQQSNGRPINNANVDLYTAGTATKVYDLTYQDNSPGLYYNTVAFADGIYDLYVSGVAVMTRISLGGTVSTADVSGIVTDSLNTFAGVNGIVFNTTNNDFGLKIVKDTTTLKAYKPDSSATMVYLKQLSSANTYGGGQFVYKSSGSALLGVRFAATGGGIWERAELAYSPDINVEWCGALPGDANDDYAAIVLAYTAALSTHGDVLFGQGIYRLSSYIEIQEEGTATQTSVRRPYFIGKGRNRTELLFYNNTDGFWFNGGGNWIGDWGLRDLHIQGNSKAAGSEGVIMDSLGQGGIDGCYIEGFETGVRVYQCNQSFISNTTLRDNVFGIYATVSPNEFYIENTYIIETDSIGIYQSTGNGTYMVGGQIQSGDIGVYIENGGLTVENVNSESVLKYFAYLGTNGVLVARRTNVIAGTDSTRFAYVAGGTLKVSTCGLSGNHADSAEVIMTGTNAQFECDNYTPFIARWTPTTVKYDYNGTTNMRGLSSSTIASLGTAARWGKFFKLHHRPSVMSEVPFYVAKMVSNDYYPAPLLNGTDQRVSLNTPTAKPSLDIYPLRFVHGYITFQFPIDADSIKNFTVVVDTFGWNTIIDAGCFIDYNQPADTTKQHGYRAWIADNDGASGTGTLLFCVDWTGNATLPNNAVNYTFRWWAVIRPNRWVQ